MIPCCMIFTLFFFYTLRYEELLGQSLARDAARILLRAERRYGYRMIVTCDNSCEALIVSFT